jgi:NAD(P)-dependent dehydrogenase (short-subunit alcohol dehydrogenase family)
MKRPRPAAAQRPARSPRTPPLPSADEFAGRVAVVTGGSDGLGRDLVAALVALGAEVFFCGSTRATGRGVATALGPRAHFIQADLRDPAAARAFVRQAAAFNGRIDYLVNNAAIDPRIRFEQATVEDFDRLMAVNLRPLFVVSQAALPALRRGRGRAIVNLATTNFLLGLSPFTLYNASKSGIVGFTRSLARELGPRGIRVNAVSPGWIMTEKQRRVHASPRDRAELKQAQALKFLLTEEHVTPLTLFLLSRSAGGITGQNVVVDGGKFMQ